MVDALTVYADDSGSNSESKIAAAAFCVSTVERWQKFLRKWQKIAVQAGFDLKDFHMTEFVACRRDKLCEQCQHGKNVNHPWKNWSDGKRRTVLTLEWREPWSKMWNMRSVTLIQKRIMTSMYFNLRLGT